VVVVIDDNMVAISTAPRMDNEAESGSVSWVPFQKKIRRNIERDREVTDYNIKNGWTILRFFESEIKKDLNACIITTIETASRLKGSRVEYTCE
jgi:G:T-mismatch repair DNA endonuclease (very short patch repair protein)